MPLGHQQGLQVEEEVRRLVHKGRAALRRGAVLQGQGRQGHLARLLHHLLADALGAPCEEFLGVAALQVGGGAPPPELGFQPPQPGQCGQRGAFAIEPQILYVRQGLRIRPEGGSEINLKSNSIDVPVLASLRSSTVARKMKR